MPAVTISAVDTGTETLTATAHGLVTGDRFRVRNVGGALPTGLTSVTDYFAIRTDNNNLKPAASSALAIAGTPINITGAGSGTNTIEHGLPYAIPTALAATGTQIKSSDANGTWNALVAIYGLLTAQAQSIWTSVQLAVGLVMGANQHVTVSGTGEFKHGDVTMCISSVSGNENSVWLTNSTTRSMESQGASGGAADLVVNLPLKLGDRIKSIRFVISGNGVADLITTVRLISAGTVSSSLGVNTTNNASSGRQTIALDVTDTTIAIDQSIVITFESSAAGLLVENINYTFDHP